MDLGITGADQVAEHDALIELEGGGLNGGGVEEVMDLGFGKCKLQVQVPDKGQIHEVGGLVGKNVRTSFVALTERYFRRLEDKEAQVTGWERTNGNGKSRAGTTTKIKPMSGSVEAACALGLADGIVDLVGKRQLLPLRSVGLG